MRKRLFFDCEVSSNIAMVWQPGTKVSIGVDSIIKERAIICICYKWEGEKECHALTWDAKQCDKKMLEKFVKIANEADEIIGHNGDRFGLAWVRTRCLYHGIQMFPKYVTIDTLKVARSKFKFNSNKLNYIAKFLGIGQKIHTDLDLWKNIMLNRDKSALEKMVTYCKNDVILLEKVFKHLNTHIEPKTHYGVIHHQDRGSCPECGSDELVIQQTKYNARGTKILVLQCKTCHKFHRKNAK